MTEVSLAWLLTKVTAPVVGATKMHHVEGAAKIRGSDSGSRRTLLSGRGLRTAPAGRCDGTEHSGSGKRTARVVYRKTENREELRYGSTNLRVRKKQLEFCICQKSK